MLMETPPQSFVVIEIPGDRIWLLLLFSTRHHRLRSGPAKIRIFRRSGLTFVGLSLPSQPGFGGCVRTVTIWDNGGIDTIARSHCTEMSRSAREVAAADFRNYMQRSNELHASYLNEPGQMEQYDRFTEWQMAYLLTMFTDLHERPGYGDAIDFTMSDLAGVGISDRDRDLERASPAITRMLPQKALETIAVAAKLNARVLEVNLGIFTRLQADNRLLAGINARDYCVACRESSTLEECVGMVHLATNLGGALKTLVKVPLLGAMLRAMRGPAHAAGFGALQEFLEGGYTKFREIPDIDLFLGEIDTRMTKFFEAIFTKPLDQIDANVES